MQTYLSAYIEDIKEGIKEAESEEEDDDGANGGGNGNNIRAVIEEDNDVQNQFKLISQESKS